MNRLLAAVVRLFAAPRIDVRRDYPLIRRIQRGTAVAPIARLRAEDYHVATSARSHRVPVRVFEPSERTRAEVLLFFHGGGWVTGDVESYTPACATMADQTGCTVVSVDYRLAPEHPFPAGLDDCLGVARRAFVDPELTGLEDPDRIVLIGDSAGGNLAAVVSQQLRDLGISGPKRQILLYPVTDADHDPATSPHESVRLHGEGLRLTSTEVQADMELYVPDPQDRRDPRVAPLLAADLSRQPRTLVMTAELDLLRDEGEAYGLALREAGGSVRIHRVGEALHGFITLPRIARPVREAYRVINAFLDEPLDAAPEEQAGSEGGAGAVDDDRGGT